MCVKHVSKYLAAISIFSIFSDAFHVIVFENLHFPKMELHVARIAILGPYRSI